jgi:histidine ammonia-lyase
MACHGARRLLQMTENLFHIVGIEALTGAQGVELRQPLVTSVPLSSAIARFRADVPAVVNDRYMAPDLAAAADLVHSGALAAPVHDLLPEVF